MTKLIEFLDHNERAALAKRSMPRWSDPMLATLTEERFNHKDWIFERKLDGERVLVFKKDASVELFSRNRKNISKTYPELVERLEEEKIARCILDGEIVAFSGKITSFSRLQQRMQIKKSVEARKSDVAVFLYVFDILYFDGYATEDLALRRRKEILRRALRFEGSLRFTPHRNEQGVAFYQQACHKGWEGIIAKDANAAYAHSRSRNWLKFKCSKRQELVVGGWTEPGGQRRGFGALLVGYYQEKKLVYAGKVGTGYNGETLRRLHRQLVSHERSTSPFDRGEDTGSTVHYCTPKLVAEIGFNEWTEDGRLRHPRFIGLRRDKEASEVVREG